MMNPPPYTITNESITVVVDGTVHTVQRGTPNYLHLRGAILDENWDAITDHLTVASSVEKWAKGKFKVDGDRLLFEGSPVPRELNERITELATQGDDPTPVLNFWERLQKNPSFRSVKQLWGFLQHAHIPLTPDGCFLAYKGVRPDYADCHSGKFSNKPGATHEMPRNQISDDPDVACHEGFHVGSVAYARDFGQRCVVCKIDPEHVVCVPKDANQQKMRVCKYQVIGNYGADLPSTVFREESLVDNDEEYDDEVEDEEEDEEEVEEELPTEAPPKPFKGPKGWTKFHKMDVEALMQQGIMDLRQYAGKGLLILGSSKIPGGKTALVSRILEVRKGEE